MSKRKNPKQSKALVVPSKQLLDDLRELIRTAREGVAQSVNSALVLLYWRTGHRIHKEVLGARRAEYGEGIVSGVSSRLTLEFGDGFSRPNLFRMVRFAETFDEETIVSTLSRQLGWSHFVEIIPLKDKLQREFYSEMCRIERWSVRTLRQKIGSLLFERTALSKKPAKLAALELKALREEDKLTPDLVFRDPYLLNFLGLKDTFSEKDIEAAILRELERFILELGVGFTFVARQKRIALEDEDCYLDLLFYHRRLRRLIAIELKLDTFKAAHKGQMELYLRWLTKHEREPHEEAPLGLILCAGKSASKIELLELDKSGIHVAAYLTELPSPAILRQKLNESIALAKERLELGAPSSSPHAARRKTTS